MTPAVAQPHYPMTARCGLCGDGIHLEYPPLLAPGLLDGERLGRILMLHVKYGCRVTRG